VIQEVFLNMMGLKGRRILNCISRLDWRLINYSNIVDYKGEIQGVVGVNIFGCEMIIYICNAKMCSGRLKNYSHVCSLLKNIYGEVL
jgi:hypothetical protein